MFVRFVCCFNMLSVFGCSLMFTSCRHRTSGCVVLISLMSMSSLVVCWYGLFSMLNEATRICSLTGIVTWFKFIGVLDILLVSIGLFRPILFTDDFFHAMIRVTYNTL